MAWTSSEANDRALELKALKKVFGNSIPSPSRSATKCSAISNKINSIWLGRITVVEREPKIKETVEELDYAENRFRPGGSGSSDTAFGAPS